MTPKQADKLIAAGRLVTVQVKPGLPFGGQPWTLLPVSRDRWSFSFIAPDTGQTVVLDRGELMVLPLAQAR